MSDWITLETEDGSSISVNINSILEYLHKYQEVESTVNK